VGRTKGLRNKEGVGQEHMMKKARRQWAGVSVQRQTRNRISLTRPYRMRWSRGGGSLRDLDSWTCGGAQKQNVGLTTR